MVALTCDPSIKLMEVTMQMRERTREREPMMRVPVFRERIFKECIFTERIFRNTAWSKISETLRNLTFVYVDPENYFDSIASN